MSDLVGRPSVRPRLRVNFNARDFIASFGHPRSSGQRDWPTNGYDVYLTTSGRASLYLLLKSIGLRPGSRIGVPLFVCDAVFEAIVRAGHHPVFLDVDPTTMILSASQLPTRHSIDALVAVHLFGNPVDVESVVSHWGVPVIEDCAHALFSSVRGKRVGTIGSGAIYSFGLGKPISIGNLGAAVVPDVTFVEEITRTTREMPQESQLANAYRAIRSFAISALYRSPWYGMFSYELGRLFEHSLDPMNHGVPDYEVSRRGARGLLEGKFRSYQEDLTAQQERWRALFDAVSDGSADLVIPQAIEKHVLSDSWMFAVRCPSSSARDGLAKSLLRRGIDSIKMYEQVPLIARTRYGYVGGAPIADELCQTVLGLPVSSTGPVDDSSLASLFAQAVRTVR